jgi:hypothetical protein
MSAHLWRKKGVLAILLILFLLLLQGRGAEDGIGRKTTLPETDLVSPS